MLGTVTITTVTLNASSTVNLGNNLLVVDVEGDLSVSFLGKDQCLRLMRTVKPSSGLPGNVNSVWRKYLALSTSRWFTDWGYAPNRDLLPRLSSGMLSSWCSPPPEQAWCTWSQMLCTPRCLICLCSFITPVSFSEPSTVQDALYPLQRAGLGHLGFCPDLPPGVMRGVTTHTYGPLTPSRRHELIPEPLICPKGRSLFLLQNKELQKMILHVPSCSDILTF